MNEPNTTLRLDRLTLTNFRCFDECSLELDPSLTVLVAENAQGKTAILNAMSIALRVFADTMRGKKQIDGFHRSDIHQIRTDKARMHLASMVEFKAVGLVGGESVNWARSLSSHSSRAKSTTKDIKEMLVAAKRLREPPANSDADMSSTIPFVAFYGTGRLWDEHRLTEGKRSLVSASSDRFSAYEDCLSPSSSFKTFAAWYEETANSLRNSTSKVYASDERPEKLLAAVRKAVEVALEPTGWTEIDWEFSSTEEQGMPQQKGYLVVEHAARGRLPLLLLSDGVRNMVALVGDVAHRCVRLNPHLGENAASLTPGILLIDEVDMHLHPSWQQRIVGLLQKAFPAMQMIFTTHSPQVISTVTAPSVRIIQVRDGCCIPETPAFQTRGVESAAILAKIMGVDPVPAVAEAHWLSTYRAMVQTDTHETAEARELWDRLLTHFGIGHPVLVEIETLRRLQDFKRENQSNSSQK